MKGQMFTARLPQETIRGIDEFQKKHNIEFRTDALIEIVKVACSAVGIDLSNIPIPADPESPVATQEDGPFRWECPYTGRIADYVRCEGRLKQHREECKACKVIPQYFRGVIFPGEETGQEEETKEDGNTETIGQENEKEKTNVAEIVQEQKETIAPTVPQEKDTVEVQEANTPKLLPETATSVLDNNITSEEDDTGESQQAVIIKALRARRESANPQEKHEEPTPDNWKTVFQTKKPQENSR